MFCKPIGTLETLRASLEALADPQHYLFSVGDFSALFPQKTPAALMVLLGRAVKNGNFWPEFFQLETGML